MKARLLEDEDEAESDNEKFIVNKTNKIKP